MRKPYKNITIVIEIIINKTSMINPFSPLFRSFKSKVHSL